MYSTDKKETNDLAEAISLILSNYNGDKLSLARSASEDKKVIDMLTSAEESLARILLAEHPGSNIWTEAVRPVKRWPHTPWIAFGMMEGERRMQLYNSRHGLAWINCAMMFDTGSMSTALAIAPVVKDMRRLYENRWSSEFRPMKEDMRALIGWLSDEGFKLDDGATVKTVKNSPGDMIRRSIVAYRMFETEELNDRDLRAAIHSITTAYMQLLL